MIFKFYEAEAYVIPTGSMATTLMGRHKDVHCQACGYPFQVSASEERDRNNRATGSQVLGDVPQCRLTQRFEANDTSYPRPRPGQQVHRVLSTDQALGSDRLPKP